MAKRPRLKMIVWEDAYNGQHSWISIDDLDKIEPMIVTTVGYEIARSKKRVTLAMSYYRDGDKQLICDLFIIPVGMIRKETIL